MITLADCRVDLMSEADALDLIVASASRHDGPALGVASANVDHLHHFGPRGAHRDAAMHDTDGLTWINLLDGAPLVLRANYATGARWPRLAGSDLIAPILARCAEAGVRVGFLGGSAQMQEVLRQRLAHDYPTLSVTGYWAPEREELQDDELAYALARRVADAGVDLLVVGLGKPRQEVWIQRYGQASGARVLLAFGASGDFLAGQVQRAPDWARKNGLEWSYRLAKEPRRLARRYLVQGPPAVRDLLRSRPVPGPSPVGPFRSVSTVAVVVVTYNSAGEIAAFLDSLPAASPGLTLRTIVVDNSSTDDTRDIVASRSDVRLVESGGNLGFAAGVNIGRQLVPDDTDAIAVLNPDLVLGAESLTRLAEALGDSRVGVAVPRIENAQGSPFYSLRRQPRLMGAIGEAAFGDRVPRRPRTLTDTLRRDDDYRRDHDVEWASGAAWMIARDCDREVGAWDENFFLYSEETEYARRVRAAGYAIRYVAEARVRHVGGASGSSTTLDALQAVNRIRDYERTHSAPATTAFRGAVALRHALRSGRASDRQILKTVLSRRSWDRLPSARRDS